LKTKQLEQSLLFIDGLRACLHFENNLI